MNPQTIEKTKDEIIAKYGEWTAHNIHLGHGLHTRGKRVFGDELKVRRIVQLIADLSRLPWNQLRILDLGCNEGLYAIEFAQRGASVIGIEGRETNIVKAEFAKDALGLSNVTFVQSDVRELSTTQYGMFDVVLCLGLFYHLDTPEVFDLAQYIRQACRGFAIVDTQISLSYHEVQAYAKTSFWANPDLLGPLESRSYRERTYWGRSAFEHDPRTSQEDRLKSLWASLDNPQSFWFTRSSLVNVLIDAGFTTVFETHAPALGYPPNRVTMVALPSDTQEVVVAPLAQQYAAPPLAETQAVYLETGDTQENRSTVAHQATQLAEYEATITHQATQLAQALADVARCGEVLSAITNSRGYRLLGWSRTKLLPFGTRRGRMARALLRWLSQSLRPKHP